jgi:hypothetical protein
MWIRLGAIVVGVICTGIRWAAEWQSDMGNGYHAICEWSRFLLIIQEAWWNDTFFSRNLVFILGFILSSLSKHMNHGNNPGTRYLFVSSQER